MHLNLLLFHIQIVKINVATIINCYLLYVSVYICQVRMTLVCCLNLWDDSTNVFFTCAEQRQLIAQVLLVVNRKLCSIRRKQTNREESGWETFYSSQVSTFRNCQRCNAWLNSPSTLEGFCSVLSAVYLKGKCIIVYCITQSMLSKFINAWGSTSYGLNFKP